MSQLELKLQYIKKEAREFENSFMDTHRNVQIKREPIDIVKVEPITHELISYTDHKINNEIAIDPEVLRTSMAVQSRHTQPYKCDTCQKCFATKDILRNHIIIHFQEEPFERKFYNNSFICKSLNNHILTHTGECS